MKSRTDDHIDHINPMFWPWHDMWSQSQEVSAKARRESTKGRELLAMATEHLSKQLLKDGMKA